MMKRIFMMTLLLLSFSLTAAAQSVEFNDLLAKAQAGNAAARKQTAVACIKGIGTEQDAAKGFYWMQMAGKDDPEAAYLSALCLLYGRGTEADTAKGLAELENSYRHGFAPAATCLGTIYSEGKLAEYYNGTTPYIGEEDERYDFEIRMSGYLLFIHGEAADIDIDLHSAFDWFVKAAEMGEPHGLTSLAYIYLEDYEKYSFIEPDAKRGIELLTAAAENGGIWAMQNLAKYYAEGVEQAVEPDSNESFKWDLKAAEAGSVHSKTIVGIEYLKGEGVEPNADEGLRWIREAADKDNYALAQSVLGDIYMNGEYAPKDTKKALYWYKKAADQGHANAQYCIGVYYSNQNDWDSAVEWMIKSVETEGRTSDTSLKCDWIHYAYMQKYKISNNMDDFYEALKWLRLMDKYADSTEDRLKVARHMIFIGEEIPANRAIQEIQKEGIMLLEELSVSGYADAQYLLALCYGTGKGVKVNRNKENELYKAAARKGHQRAIEMCRKLNLRY